MSKHDENVFKIQLEKVNKAKLEKPNKTRNSRFEDWEIAFIKANYLVKTDKELAEDLNRKIVGIARQRKKLGLTKKVGRPEQTVAQETQSDLNGPQYEVV